ncbi:hypothetical protein CAC42_3202 [Sphaceloma murrayae]|uniref:RRM domain-containing protein n=1 Tax=Sphaceloma murrayae TaxID=2082308 RepID=A0A2K1QRU5_9PEZI|nr:hypothetical protein CAC42_3202 [Sphaceloma murrayae]
MATFNGDGFPAGASETIYCRNLPDKLPKDDLKRELYMLFATYGPVLDVVALKTHKMRGQAHQISYAKSKSDTLAKLDGTYKQPAPPSDLQATETQRSIFAGPPGTQPTGAAQATLGPPPSLRPDQAASPASAATPASQGVKRSREDSEGSSDDGDEGAPMDMDDAPMDESDDD